VDDASERLMSALEQWEHVAEMGPPDDAVAALDEATLQVFWQRWPDVASWGGALWRRLNADLADAATPVEESEFHDVGGEGG
jgi:hypothetical protein